MSEKPTGRAMRAVGAHPDSIPQPVFSGLGLDGESFTGKTISRRRLMPVPDGQIGALEPSSPPSVQGPEPLVFYGPEKPRLDRWFKEGTRIYSLDFHVPVTEREGNDRSSGVLEEAMSLPIDMGNLVWSKKLGRWREKVKQEDKSTLFGGFVVVEAPVINKRGERVIVRGFASLKDLQKEDNNPLARFKKATQ